jgi:protein SCO1/2
MSVTLRRLIVPLIALGLGLATLVIAAVIVLRPPAPTGAAAIGGSFKLVSHEGKAVTEQDFRGAPHLVFFGFTHCPDVCPTKLFEISEVLRAAGERGRAVRALFITVDPERDTPEALKSYLASFDERIVGLTGDRPAVDATVRSFRAYARKAPLKDGDYTMEHTSLVYLMDGRGRFVGSLNLARPPAEAAQDLLRHL